MKSRQFTVLVVVAFVGGIVGGFVVDRVASIGQAFANGVQNNVGGEEMELAMDIRKKYERNQQGTGQHNRKILELIRNKILPENEYAAQLETARNEIQGMDLDELREKLASLQATNICLINFMGNLLYAQEKPTSIR